jgi:vanillate/4-hydroxybenzoate decarboxylase subunit C
MPYRSLRDFLAKAEAEGQLVRIKEQVLPEPDIRAAACAAGRLPGGPVLLFEHIRGYGDKQVAMNVHGSWQNHALMLDLPKETDLKAQFHEFSKRWDRYPVPPKRVGNAPLKEVIIDKNPSLFRELPLFRVNPMDGGFYLSKACVVSRDPENPEIQNVGIYRLQVKDHDRIGIQAGAQHDLGVHLRKAEELNIPLRVAIAVSNEPVTSLVACTPLKYDEDEYSMVGAIRGEPAEIITSERGNLDVPAGAEVVIEGEILPRQRFVEGPFAEFTGYYSASMIQAEMKVDLISRRGDPIIFENLYTGLPWNEIDYLMALDTSVTLFKQMKPEFPEIDSINAMYTHGYCVIISSRMRFGGFAKTLGCRLLSTPHGIVYPKFIIIVDEDIDPFDLQQVLWAITVRFRPERDLVVIPNAPGSTVDPAHLVRGLATKVIIDATKPAFPDVPMSEASVVEIPPEVPLWMEKILKKMKGDR